MNMVWCSYQSAAEGGYGGTYETWAKWSASHEQKRELRFPLAVGFGYDDQILILCKEVCELV